MAKITRKIITPIKTIYKYTSIEFTGSFFKTTDCVKVKLLTDVLLLSADLTDVLLLAAREPRFNISF